MGLSLRRPGTAVPLSQVQHAGHEACPARTRRDPSLVGRRLARAQRQRASADVALPMNRKSDAHNPPARLVTVTETFAASSDDATVALTASGQAELPIVDPKHFAVHGEHAR